jgi:hypothetical protein
VKTQRGTAKIQNSPIQQPANFSAIPTMSPKTFAPSHFGVFALKIICRVAGGLCTKNVGHDFGRDSAQGMNSLHR